MDVIVEPLDMPQEIKTDKVHVSVRLNRDLMDEINSEAIRRGVKRTEVIQERLEFGGNLIKHVRVIYEILAELNPKLAAKHARKYRLK